MSISSIASSSVYQSSFTNPFQTVKKDFKNINSALQSGDLSAAQTAFSAFQTDSSAINGNNNSSNPMSQDIQGLGSALKSGSLTDAQQAFSKIQSDMKGHGKFARQQMELQSSLSSGSDTGNTIKQDFNNLSTALSSGNLTDAQKAFATLQQDAPAQNSQNNSQFSKDIQSLGNALQSGDLSSAQQVFSTMQTKMSQGLQNQTTSSTTSAATSNNPVQLDFQNLSAALQSGNVADAQKAFATLQQDMATAKSTASGSTGGHHHHHHSGSSQSAGGANSADLLNALTANSSSTSNAANTTTASNSTTNLSSLLESAISNYMQSSSNSNIQNGLSSSSLFSTPTFA